MSTDAKPRTKRNGHAKSENVASTLRDSANQIWLAGLGAYARAEEEGTRVFDQLVALGERVEARARDQVLRPIHAAERKATEVRDSASGVYGHIRLAFERRVARVLNTLQIPTSRDIDELTQRVEELTVALERMERRAAAQRSTTASRSKSGAKKSSTRAAPRKRRATGTRAAASTARRTSTRKSAAGGSSQARG